jgi:hypothetical protein
MDTVVQQASWRLIVNCSLIKLSVHWSRGSEIAIKQLNKEGSKLDCRGGRWVVLFLPLVAACQRIAQGTARPSRKLSHRPNLGESPGDLETDIPCRDNCNLVYEVVVWRVLALFAAVPVVQERILGASVQREKLVPPNGSESSKVAGTTQVPTGIGQEQVGVLGTGQDKNRADLHLTQPRQAVEK